ncbi:hypothetical protein K0M31_005681 [Melipona bicolor]|uniref:Uncharacterized protein n=1 Tax=Melipona bicolor TaxID=60889 RepID=A0AA40KM43_9HYME|nr:hypothetical protein K0M31_005681 [Melipona bicolor]
MDQAADQDDAKCATTEFDIRQEAAVEIEQTNIHLATSGYTYKPVKKVFLAGVGGCWRVLEGVGGSIVWVDPKPIF